MRALFLAGVAVLLLAAMALVPLGLVAVKMLPFDNKSEFQVMVDMPEAPRSRPRRASRRRWPRRAGGRGGRGRAAVRRHVRAVQLQRAGASLLPAPGAAPGRPPGEPRGQGRALGAKPRRRAARARPAAADRALVRRHPAGRRGAARSARAADAGRRGLRTRSGRRMEVAAQVKAIFEQTPGVVDTDWYVEAPQPKVTLAVDGEKAAAAGLSSAAVASLVRMAGRARWSGCCTTRGARGRADRPAAAARRPQPRGAASRCG